MENIEEIFITFASERGYPNISNRGDWTQASNSEGDYWKILDRRELHKDIYIEYESASTWYRFGIGFEEGQYVNYFKEETKTYDKFIDAICDIEKQPFYIKTEQEKLAWKKR